MIYTRLHSSKIEHTLVSSNNLKCQVCDFDNVATMLMLPDVSCLNFPSELAHTSDDFQEPKWFKFNDDSVSIVDLEQAAVKHRLERLFVPGKIG